MGGTITVMIVVAIAVGSGAYVNLGSEVNSVARFAIDIFSKALSVVVGAQSVPSEMSQPGGSCTFASIVAQRVVPSTSCGLVPGRRVY